MKDRRTKLEEKGSKAAFFLLCTSVSDLTMRSVNDRIENGYQIEMIKPKGEEYGRQDQVQYKAKRVIIGVS